MTALQALILEQQQDDRSRRISKNKREINLEPQSLAWMPVSWGEPPQLAICNIDHTCAHCNSRKPTYDHTRQIAGISFLRAHKQIVGACCDCGFSF